MVFMVETIEIARRNTLTAMGSAASAALSFEREAELFLKRDCRVSHWA